ncbi:nuclear transport factor 2 family protein [Paraflavitalea soli]|uniref:Nuclear transport factor 2 family protein n=1 Tax=Paraflavitalea soli TaxID=2315862 RepID=A0A3B7MM88_9BACT|nr:nuclear transport factor 2 family protein [Paraflavitalea soli]AXY72725.1 nuclear transport factor 2 family protein [Paraflavitalea soli]
MKQLLFTALLICCWWNSSAQIKSTMETQQHDSTAIAQALENYYFKGIYTGDLTLLHQVYQPGILLFGDVKGKPYAKTLDQYLDGVKNRQSPKAEGSAFKGTILNIRVVNSIAVAEVTVKMYAFIYHEFLSFHQINGQWVIVNKMLTDVSQ